MIRKRKLILVTVLVLILYLVTTHYILTVLTKTESEVVRINVEEKILEHYQKLSKEYSIRANRLNNVTLLALRNLDVYSNYDLVQLWGEANKWVTSSEVVNFQSPNLGNTLHALKYTKIVKADLDTRGTQLKLLLTLKGNQQVVFKPKWYELDKVIEGPVYAGKDRFGSEILGFYLSILLRKPLTPLSVVRDISLKLDVIPVATQRLLETTFIRNNVTCIYGKCYYCKKEDPICENERLLLTGAVIFNLKVNLKSHRSPWQRTYKKNKKALWEEDDDFCSVVRSKYAKKRVYDLIDVSIFDFLLQNGDRHHYETMDDAVLMLDNGKGLGNPFVHHLDILAPLYQCCMLRQETLKTLRYLTGGTLRETLEKMPDIKKIVTRHHLKAIENRLLMVFATIEYCRNKKNNLLNLK